MAKVVDLEIGEFGDSEEEPVFANAEPGVDLDIGQLGEAAGEPQAARDPEAVMIGLCFLFEQRRPTRV